ncbi:hypothetical protein DFS33DRAFT_1269108 [Desarmillaria ectypa]|nr:hypothetical protein DFS33DRAFT_1269108 [Desarmillaria ectypa]
MKTIYGYDVDLDGFIQLAVQSNEALRIGETEGTLLVDYLQILSCVPAKFRKLAKTWVKDARAVIEESFAYASESIANSDEAPFFVSENVKKMKQTEFSDSETSFEIIKNVAGLVLIKSDDVFHGIEGVLTLFSTSTRSYLKPLDGIQSSPQVMFLMLALIEDAEDFRQGIAHCSVTDEVYPTSSDQYYNEKDYPNSTIFDPERFMKKKDKELLPDPMAAFGYGRRPPPIHFKCMIKARPIQAQALIESGSEVEQGSH